MLKHYKLIATLFLLLTLSACGFHLRQPLPLAKPLQNIYVQSRTPYGDLTRNIKQYLQMSGVHLAASPEQAATVLNITQEVMSQDLISINSSQQTRQYNLRLSVTFEVTDPKGSILIAPQTLTELRPLTLQSNQILAGSNQATQIYRDMRRALTFNLMNRLASKGVTSALLHPEPQVKP
jgi:LPS-assembly lipoprotein